MKSKITRVIVLLAFLSVGKLSAQNIFPGTGNVGIGTTAPSTPLHIKTNYLGALIDATTSGWTGMYINAIGTSGMPFYGYRIDGSNRAWHYLSPEGHWRLYVAGERLSVLNNGNVLINKTTQSNSAYKLDVNGSVRANEVVVNTTGADFVFQDDYKLLSLEEVETFIKSNKHLPDVPSAAVMSSEGMNVGDLSTTLLQKIEELTLHTIELSKQMEILKKENVEIKSQLKEAKKK